MGNVCHCINEFNPHITCLLSYRLYTDNDRLTTEAKSQLSTSNGEVDPVQIFPYKEIASHIVELVSSTEEKIWVFACNRLF